MEIVTNLILNRYNKDVTQITLISRFESLFLAKFPDGYYIFFILNNKGLYSSDPINHVILKSIWNSTLDDVVRSLQQYQINKEINQNQIVLNIPGFKVILFQIELSQIQSQQILSLIDQVMGKISNINLELEIIRSIISS